jgi:hypothetical protein
MDRDYWLLSPVQLSGRQVRRWFGHGKDAKGKRIEDVFTTRPSSKSITVEGTYRINGEQFRLMKELPVQDLIREAIPEIRKDISKKKRQ